MQPTLVLCTINLTLFHYTPPRCTGIFGFYFYDVS